MPHLEIFHQVQHYTKTGEHWEHCLTSFIILRNKKDNADLGDWLWCNSLARKVNLKIA